MYIQLSKDDQERTFQRTLTLFIFVMNMLNNYG